MRIDGVLVLAGWIWGVAGTTSGATQPAVTSEAAGDLGTTTFSLPQGTVNVYLPEGRFAGDTLSGTVLVEEKGATPQERQKNRDELNGYVVEVEHQATPVARGTLTWQVPAALAAAASYLSIRDSKGNEVAGTQLPLRPGPPPPRPDPGSFHLPAVGQAGRPIHIRGPFSGDLTRTAAWVGGSKARVLAESPRGLSVVSPPDLVGPTQLEVHEGDAVARGNYRAVGVRLTAGKETLRAGERTQLGVNVRGLEGLAAPLNGWLRNLTPGVVTIASGDIQLLTIRPQDVAPSGTYSFSQTLIGVRPGGFTINVTIADPISLVPSSVSSGWGCEDCGRECLRKAEHCGVLGSEKIVGEESVRECKSSTGETWRQYRAQRFECASEDCDFAYVYYCCSYTHWQDKGPVRYWKVKGVGDANFRLPVATIPFDCGRLIDLLELVGAAGFSEKQDMLDYAANLYKLKPVKLNDLEGMAKGCGLEELYKAATALRAKDFVDWLAQFLKAFKNE
jgi:hypothetical protein